jgi:phosphonate transport system substrate-binding protein
MRNDRRHFLAGGLALVTALVALPLRAEDYLTLGIMPFNSALALVRTHQPLRQALEAKLGTPIDVYTAADYESFLRESLAGRYDLLITGPHFAVMSIEKGYVPLVHYKAPLQPIFVVRPDSGIGGPEALRGKVVALSSRFSVSSIGGIKWLADKGLQAGRDYRIREYPTHGAAVAAVAVGEADAALTTHTPLKQIPPDVRDKVTILPSEFRVPHLMTLAHQRLGKQRIEAIRQALMEFAASEDGKRFFADTGYEGYVPVSEADLQALRPYVAIIREQMKLDSP